LNRTESFENELVPLNGRVEPAKLVLLTCLQQISTGVSMCYTH